IINPGSGSDDAAYYIIKGNETLLSDQDGSGSESVSVENGDIVGFRIRTSTNTGGAGVLTISNFSAPVGAGGEAGEISGSDELCIGEIEIYTSDGDSGGSWTSDDED